MFVHLVIAWCIFTTYQCWLQCVREIVQLWVMHSTYVWCLSWSIMVVTILQLYYRQFTTRHIWPKIKFIAPHCDSPSSGTLACPRDSVTTKKNGTKCAFSHYSSFHTNIRSSYSQTFLQTNTHKKNAAYRVIAAASNGTIIISFLPICTLVPDRPTKPAGVVGNGRVCPCVHECAWLKGVTHASIVAVARG